MAYYKLKGEICERFSEKLSIPFTRRTASKFENKNHGVRLVISVSKRYEITSDLYWYGFNESQIDYLDQARQGYFIIGFLDSERAFAIPHEKMKEMAKEMHYTKHQSGKNYHVHVRFHKGREVIGGLRSDNKIFEFLKFEILPLHPKQPPPHVVDEAPPYVARSEVNYPVDGIIARLWHWVRRNPVLAAIGLWLLFQMMAYVW